MAVVFEEVIASVEAPRPAEPEISAAAPSHAMDDDELKTLQMLETRQRRQQRLMAD